MNQEKVTFNYILRKHDSNKRQYLNESKKLQSPKRIRSEKTDNLFKLFKFSIYFNIFELEMGFKQRCYG